MGNDILVVVGGGGALVVVVVTVVVVVAVVVVVVLVDVVVIRIMKSTADNIGKVLLSSSLSCEKTFGVSEENSGAANGSEMEKCVSLPLMAISSTTSSHKTLCSRAKRFRNS